MRHIRELILWAGAALGLLAVAAGLAVAFGGFSFLIFRSGSMSPEIPTGGIALSQHVDAADIRSGDVVSVIASGGDRVTHRVVSSTMHDDVATLVLKGDANATEDPELYVVSSADRVVASLPYGGYVLVHALTPPGLLAMASLSMMLIVASGRRAEGDDPPDAPRTKARKPRHRARTSPRRRAAAGLLLVGVVTSSGAALAHTTGTWATYTDRPTAVGTYSAYAIPSPTVTCTDGSTSLSFSFPAVAMNGRTMTYDAVVTGGQLTNPVTITPTGTGATRTFTVTSTQAPGSLGGTRNYVVTVTARAAATPGVVWTASAGRNFSTYGTIFVDMTCGTAT